MDIKLLKKLLEESDDTRDVQPVREADKIRIRELMSQVDWKDPKERQALADTIVIQLENEMKANDITKYFARTDYFEVGETPEYQFTKGLKANVIEPGTFAPHSRLIKRKITLDTDLVSVNPEAEISELQGGRWGTMANFKRYALKEHAGKKNATLWTVLTSSVTAAAIGSNYGIVAQTDSLAEKKNWLISGISYVDDTAPGGVMAIVGRRSSLDFINELSGYSEVKLAELDYKTAAGKVLGAFRNIPVVALNQYTDSYDVQRIPATNIMIVANDTTVLAVTERLSSLEKLDADTRMWSNNITQKYGAAVFHTEQNYRLEIE